MNKPLPWTNEDRANLVAYLDGELGPTDSAAIEVQLSLNPQARAEAEALRRAWSMLDYLPKPEPSSRFTQHTLERLSAIRPALPAPRNKWQVPIAGIGWAAAVVLAAALGFAGGRLVNPQMPVTAEPLDIDGALVRDLGVLENKRLYEHVDSIDFLRALANPDDPDLFGDENWDS